MIKVATRWLLLAGVMLALGGHAEEPPVIPVGLDAYRQWDQWPLQRIGVRAYMRSTYDRKGGNEGADASHFLYQLADDRNVTLDVAGPGILYFVRYNHWHGSPWHYVVDGTDHVVQESSSADPVHPAAHSVFLPENLFPSPLAVTWAETKGADLSWVPIEFTNSFRMDYTRTHYGTGYYIYQQYVGGARLSQPLTSWSGQSGPDKDVLDLINNWEGDAAIAGSLAPETGQITKLESGSTQLVPCHCPAPGELRLLSFTVPLEQANAFGRARLRITWDGRREPSIDAPVALFFGAGTLYNRDHRPYLVRSFPMTIFYGETNVRLSCVFRMPFFKSARIELVGPSDAAVTNIQWRAASFPFHGPPSSVSYFHATYRDHPHPVAGHDLVLLDTREVEGGGDWSGSFVGNSWIFSDRANLSTLEGDPRFFFDDSQTPQAQGTGTEEWGGGGDYWGGANMTLPFAGHPTGAANVAKAQNADDKIESAYRFLLADLMPFGRNARICLEHGGEDQSTEHYQTVTYWYGAPAPSLVKTDVLKIGDADSEAAHRYLSPDASAPYSITSHYEWGVDTLNGQETYPVSTDEGRKTKGVSEFTLKLDPKNLGVLLRRKLDYIFPNQRAEVFIADGDAAWKSAGTWSSSGGRQHLCLFQSQGGIRRGAACG